MISRFTSDSQSEARKGVGSGSLKRHYKPIFHIPASPMFQGVKSSMYIPLYLSTGTAKPYRHLTGSHWPWPIQPSLAFRHLSLITGLVLVATHPPALHLGRQITSGIHLSAISNKCVTLTNYLLFSKYGQGTLRRIPPLLGQPFRNAFLH